MSDFKIGDIFDGKIIKTQTCGDYGRKRVVDCSRYVISLEKEDEKIVKDLNGNEHTLHKVYRKNTTNRTNIQWKSGGYIEHENNLDSSPTSTAWIDYNSYVYGNAKVKENAKVHSHVVICDNAKISGNAKVWNNTIICGNAQISDNAKVTNSWVGDNVEIGGEADIDNGTHIFGNVKIKGKTRTNSTEQQRTLITGNYTINITENEHNNEIIGLCLYETKEETYTDLNGLNSIKQDNTDLIDKEKQIINYINGGITEQATSEIDNSVSTNKYVVSRDGKKYVNCGRYYISLDESNKQEIVDIKGNLHTLHRIYRYNPITYKWESGGYIEHENNLDSSPTSTAWIDYNSYVYGNARVEGGAHICGTNTVICDNAKISGNAKVWNNTIICGNAQISGNAEVTNSWVGDNVEICDDADINESYIGNNVHIKGKAELSNGVIALDSVHINGDVTINGDVNINDNATIEGNANIKGNITINGKSNISGSTKLKGTILIKDSTISDDTKIINNTTTKDGTKIENSTIGGKLKFTNIDNISGENLKSTDEIEINKENSGNISKYRDKTSTETYQTISVKQQIQNFKTTKDNVDNKDKIERNNLLNLNILRKTYTMSPEQYNMRTKVEKIKDFSKSVKNHIEHNKNIDKTLKSSLTQNIKKIEGSIRNCNIDNYNINKENVKELEKQVNTMIESKEYGEYLKNEQDKNHLIELNELMSKQKEIETLIQPTIKEDLVIEKYKNVETNTLDNVIQNSLELESSNIVKNNIKNDDLDESEILETQIKPIEKDKENIADNNITNITTNTRNELNIKPLQTNQLKQVVLNDSQQSQFLNNSSNDVKPEENVIKVSGEDKNNKLHQNIQNTNTEHNSIIRLNVIPLPSNIKNEIQTETKQKQKFISNTIPKIEIKPTNELKNRNNQTNNTKKEENSNNLPTANSKHDRVNKPKQQKSTKLNMFDNMFNNKFGTKDNNITQMFMIASLMRMNPFIFFMLYNNLRNKEIFKSMTNIATSLDTGERNIQK